MLKVFFNLGQICLYTLGYLYATSNAALTESSLALGEETLSAGVSFRTPSFLAQVTSDGTVNTQVNQNGNVAEISGGETRGNNLFHSFQDFAVNSGNEAAFLNANDIANIFSRVTGGNISQIDGLISANSNANLFLINPAGIIFGENARLNVGGSFYGSSADGILFEDGEFSATDLDKPPVLTINAPIGLNFRDNPGEIVNRSIVQNSFEEVVGLEVLPGNNLAFVGGNIRLHRGNLTARGGNIELGGLSAAGMVDINPDGSLSFPESVPKADISLTNVADVNTTGTGGGNITVNARNLDLTTGEPNDSLIGTGISSESTSTEAQAGDVDINVAERLFLDGSRIFNQVASEGVGNAGDIAINTGSLEAINGGSISASTSGEGNAGTVDITATENITLDGKSLEGFISTITNSVESNAVGNAGGINISTTNLTLTNGGRIDASTFGKGDVGTLDITATGDINLTGENSNGSSSGIYHNSDGIGNVDGVRISTNNLNLTNGADIEITASGQGNAGTVDITATGDITLAGEGSNGFSSRIIGQVFGNAKSDTGEIIAPRGVGDVGGVRISTNNLALTDGGQINASTYGEGDAGTVDITATGDITIAGENLGTDFLNSGIFSTVNIDGLGDAGGINISTTNLTLTNGGQIDASTYSEGDGGNIVVNASESITIDGVGSDIPFPSGIFNTVQPGAVGNSGSIDLTTANLSITNGGLISADTFGKGDGGTITVNARESIIFDGISPSNSISSGIFNSVGSGAVGNSGSVDLTTANLSISNGGQINAGTFGKGNGGTIAVNASESITLDGTRPDGSSSGIFNSVGSDAVGNSGSIDLTTSNFSLSNGATIVALTQGDGNAGDLTFNISDRLTLEENSLISAQAFGTNNSGGNITINAQDGFLVAFPNQNPGIGSDIVADSPAGIDGNIEIYAQGVFGLVERDAVTSNNFLENNTNDIDASGVISGSIPRILVPRETQGIPPIITSEQTTDSACQVGSNGTAKNGLVVNGKGGVAVAPDQPLSSQNIIVNNEIASEPANPQPIVTRLGKIQLARGIKVTEDGRVLLTPYATNNAGGRMPEIKPNCG
jgi:filamentous hemagglutinin family protein